MLQHLFIISFTCRSNYNTHLGDSSKIKKKFCLGQIIAYFNSSIQEKINKDKRESWFICLRIYKHTNKVSPTILM